MLTRNYDVAPDGQRFLMLKDRARDPDSVPPHILVVQHWTGELARLTSSAR